MMNPSSQAVSPKSFTAQAAPRFGARYLLRGYAEQMDSLMKSAQEKGLPMAYAESFDSHVWCVATGKEDVANLNQFVAARQTVYDALQKDLNELVDEEVLGVLTHWQRKKQPDISPLRNANAWTIPADLVLQRIQALDLPRRSRQLVEASSPKLAPLKGWIMEQYGQLSAYTGPSSYEAVKALERGKFVLETGQFTYEALDKRLAYTELMKPLFAPTTVRNWRGRNLLTSGLPPQPEAKVIEALQKQYPNVKPELAEETVREWVREGWLRQMPGVKKSADTSKLVGITAEGLKRYFELTAAQAAQANTAST